MDSFIQTLRNLGPARLGMIGATMIGMVVFFFFLTSKMSTGNMTLLYSDMATSDAAAVTTKLDALQVPYEVSADGTQIKVPAEQVGKLRMSLAAEGLPSNGSAGYEIFDKQSSFGTSSFVQNINQIRALEGELSRSIATLGPIRQARVHLVLPKRELFAKETEPASASVLLTMRGAQSLSAEQVASIQHLVSAAVPQLKAKMVSVIDSQGNLLARGGDDEDSSGMSANLDEMKRSVEKRMTREIEDLVGRTVGVGKVRATVNTVLDYDRVATSEEQYNPDQQVARSTQTTSETGQSSEGSSTEGASVANGLPDAKAATGGSNSNNTNRTEETTNFEIGRKVINSTREVGRIQKISVAVLIDGVSTKNDKGEVTYEPRSEEEMQKIEALVKSAMGFDADRGDTVEIANMKFAVDDMGADAPKEFEVMGLGKQDIINLLQPVILGLIGILFLLLIVRPLLMRLLADAPAGNAAATGAGSARNVTSSNADGLLTDQSGGGLSALMPPNSNGFEGSGNSLGSEIERMINMEQVEGRVRASSLKKISELVDKHPDHAVSIIRNWMYQDPG